MRAGHYIACARAEQRRIKRERIVNARRIECGFVEAAVKRHAYTSTCLHATHANPLRELTNYIKSTTYNEAYMANRYVRPAYIHMSLPREIIV